MEPFCQVRMADDPEPVIFLADADQISVLNTCELSHRDDQRSGLVVTEGWRTGCHSMGVCVYAESDSDDPRAMIGLTDIHDEERNSKRRSEKTNLPSPSQ